SDYRGRFAGEVATRGLGLSAVRSPPEALPAAARAFATSQVVLRQSSVQAGRTIVFSTRLPRDGLLAVASCASLFRLDNNNRRRSISRARAIARSRSALRPRALQLAGCLSPRFVL